MYFLGSLNTQHLFADNVQEYDQYDDNSALIIERTLSVVSLSFVPFILISNSLVFWSTILCSHFHTPLNILFFSLCVSNLCMGCFCIPVFSVSYVDHVNDMTNNSTFHCVLWFITSWMAAGGSLMSLLFISIDRYIAILWPDRYKSCMTVKSAILLVTFLWLYIVIVAILPFFQLPNYQEHVSAAKRCNYFAVVPKYYSFFYTFVSIYTCLTIPLILHIFIFCKVYKQLIIFNRDFESLKKGDMWTLEDDVSTVIMTLTLVLLFILLWFPYLIIVSCNYFVDFNEKQMELLQNISQIFYFSNAIVNAPLFALVRSDYKDVYLLMLKSAPWNWRNELSKLDYRQKPDSFRKPSKVSNVKPTVQPVRRATKKIVQTVEEAPVIDIARASVSSTYPLETSIT